MNRPRWMAFVKSFPDPPTMKMQIRKLKEQGVNDIEALETAMVLTDLTHTEGWSDIELKYTPDNRPDFILARWKDSEKKTKVVPKSAGEEITFEMISQFLMGREPYSLVLAFCDPDGTITYYDIAEGIKKYNAEAEQREATRRRTAAAKKATAGQTADAKEATAGQTAGDKEATAGQTADANEATAGQTAGP